MANRLLAAALVVALGAIPGCGGDAPRRENGLVEVRQAGFRVLYMWPFFVAKDRGFFRDQGLDFELLEVDSGLLGVAAVVSGDAQIADMGVNDVANLHRQGKELVLVYQLVRRMTMDLVMSEKVAAEHGLSGDTPLTERYRALKGLTIGITRPGAVTDVFVRYFLSRGGLSPDRDAILLPVGGASALASALRTGQIDAYLLSPPIPDGLGTVVIKSSAGAVPELDAVPFVNLAMNRSWAEQHPTVVRSYVAAIRQAIAWASAHRTEALAIVARHFPEVQPPVLDRAWDDLLASFSKDGRFTQAGIERYLQILVETGQMKETPPTTEGVLWTNAYVQ